MRKMGWKRCVLALGLSAAMVLSAFPAMAEDTLPDGEAVLEERLGDTYEEGALEAGISEPAAAPETGEMTDPAPSVSPAEDVKESVLLEDAAPSASEDAETEDARDGLQSSVQEYLDLSEEEDWSELIEEEEAQSFAAAPEDETEAEWVEELEDEAVTELVGEYFSAEQSGNAADAQSAGNAAVLKNYTTYGAQLSGECKRIYDAFVNTWVKKGSTGNVSFQYSKPMTVKTTGKLVNGTLQWNSAEDTAYQKAMDNIEYQIQSAFEAFVYDYPEVFWLGSVIYTYDGTSEIVGGKRVITIKGLNIIGLEYYQGAKSDRAQFHLVLNAGVESIKSTLKKNYPNGYDRYQTVCAIHDFVCGAVSYQENAYAHNAAGVLLYHRAVCEGYAKTFKILCSRFNIPCALIVGDAKVDYGTSSEPHMWNYVKMEDGAWYLVDTTWDDGYGANTIYHNYLLLGSSSEGMYLTVGEERKIYYRFSVSDNSMSFGIPQLSKTAYMRHSWKKISEVKPDCKKPGKVEYICELHGEKKTEVLPAGHIFTKYVSDKNATALKDGTKTARCDRGCGAKHTIADAGSKLSGYAKTNAASVVLKKKQSTSGFKVTEMQKGDSIVSWTSSNTKIVTVKGKADGTCKLTAKKKTGTATVTIRFKSGYEKAFKVKVQKGNVKTKSISGVSKKLKLSKGQTFLLKPQLNPFTSKEKIKYTSSNKKVAAVSKKGKVTAKKKGTAKITVRAGKVKITCTVTVS